MNLGGAGAAGAGADALEEILRQKFTQAIQRQQMQLAERRAQVDEQRQRDQSAYQQESLASLRENRAAGQQAAKQQGAVRIAGLLAPGQQLDAQTKAALEQGDLGGLVEHKEATLGSTNYSGTADTGAKAPRILGLAKTANPGQDAKDLFTGTAAQQEAQRTREARQRLAATTTDKNLKTYIEADEAGVKLPAEFARDRDGDRDAAREDKEHLLRVAASLRPPAQQHARYNVVQGSDKDGKPALLRTNVDTGQVEVLPMPDGANFAKREQPATQDQSNLALYANRVEQADPILKSLEGAITKMNPLSFAAQLKADHPSLQSAEVQQYNQAARNFINSVLRRESGAAIAESEFQNARGQYLPVPGDSPQVLAQKAENRRIVRENFKRSAGPAYKPMSTPAGGGSDDAAKRAADLIKKYGGG